MVKHYGDFFRSRLDWVRFEARLLNHLAEHHVPVARSLLTISGDPFLPIDGTPLMVYEWAEGGVEWPSPSEKAYSLGAAIAQVHLVSSSISTDGTERTYGIDALIDAPLRLLHPYCDDPALFSKLEKQCAGFKEIVAQLPNGGDTFGPIHGDIHQGNCHFRSDGELTVIDFSLAGVGYRTYDLTGFLWPMRDQTIQYPAMRACCDSFLSGYASVRPLSEIEIQSIPVFVQLRSLWESGDWIDAGTGREHEAEVRKMVPYLVNQFGAHLES